ncbi:alpha/beta hydrolase [Dyella monticola]|uniref:Alpha/beta hydrolase n=1 Tax=Dyella monticola TaxID=1927958 RepID=A0A370WTN5_9GAMM|nr:alpha/beta hydrolase [Dyella monticola]RDS79494.1 alpha/beta hydrolase [Dyella monticola]
MSMLQVETDSLGRPIELFYEDIGYGPPIVLLHGWPFDHAMWEEQVYALAGSGCRVVAYDRRGFGKSSKPFDGYNYNRLVDDLKALLDALDLHDVTLVGFSMGAGEVVRYMSRHLGQRVARLALVSTVTPSVTKSKDNPDGADDAKFDDVCTHIRADRFTFMDQFVDRLFEGADVKRPMVDWIKSLAEPASRIAMLSCVRAFAETDFTGDMAAAINLPSLVIHGTQDRIAPFAANGRRTADLLPGCIFRPYEGAAHGLFATHASMLSEDLLGLVRSPPSQTLPPTVF